MEHAIDDIMISMRNGCKSGYYRVRRYDVVSWCSWLSLLFNTQAVPGSNPGEIRVELEELAIA